MMESLNIDLKKSIEICKKYNSQLKPHYCYNNILALTLPLKKEFESKKYKVAYGYFGDESNAFVRHCYIVTENKKVIDPSIILITKQEKIKDLSFYNYYTFAKISEKEMVSFIKKQKGNLPHLKDVLTEQERQFATFATENKLIVSIEDYENYLQRFDSKQQMIAM